MYDQLDQMPAIDEIEDRPGQRRPRGMPDPVFHACCSALALLPASLAAVLLHDLIGDPFVFLAAVVVSVWVISTLALVKIAGPLLRCRAIVAAGGLVSVAMCSLFLID